MAGAYGRAIAVNEVVKQRPIFNVGRYACRYGLCQLKLEPFRKSVMQPCASIPIEERGLDHSRHASPKVLI